MAVTAARQLAPSVDVEMDRQRLPAAFLDLGRRGRGPWLLDVGAGDAAPAAANASAVARPMPFAAPTTMAIFFSSVNAASIIASSMISRRLGVAGSPDAV